MDFNTSSTDTFDRSGIFGSFGLRLLVAIAFSWSSCIIHYFIIFSNTKEMQHMSKSATGRIKNSRYKHTFLKFPGSFNSCIVSYVFSSPIKDVFKELRKIRIRIFSEMPNTRNGPNVITNLGDVRIGGEC